MQQYFVIIMLVVCSLLAMTEYILLKKKDKQYSFYIFSFFFATYFFILSAMKYYLGYKNENIFESFWNIQSVTLIHYGIPLLVVSVIAPPLLQWIFKGTACKIIRLFDSVMFFAMAFVWLLVREVNNRVYCVAFLIAIIISMLAIGYIKRNEPNYFQRKNMKTYLNKSLPFILYWLVAVAIYIPNELYLNNATDFPMSYWYFFRTLLFSSLIAGVVLLVGMIVYLSERQLNIFCVLLFVLLIVGYIQGMFLNGSMSVLDGTQQSWSISQYSLNLGIWIILAGAIIALSVWKKEKVYKIMQVVCIWLSLTQAVSLAVLMISSDDTVPKSELLLTTDGMLEVGEANNIIVFVLDKFDGRRMDEILEETPDFLNQLQDFTYYENATNEFLPTENSIPFLLTGASYQKDLPPGQYTSYAYNKDALINEIYGMNYEIGVYTNPYFVSEEVKDIVSNYQEGIQRECDIWELFTLMTQCSRYRMAPYIAKNYYQYDTSDIELLVEDDRITNIENDLPFYNRLINEGLQVKEDKSSGGVFRFIHMHGNHPPYIMTEEFQYIEYDEKRDDGWRSSGISQAKGALKIVFEYIRQLKELGKYDDATIIITADHGYTERLSDDEGNMKDISFPILFVKEPYEHNEDEMKISHAPVCHEDVIATIRDLIGMDVVESTLKGIQEDEKRTRILKISHADLFEEYAVNGDVRDINNWNLLYSNGKFAGSVIRE